MDEEPFSADAVVPVADNVEVLDVALIELNVNADVNVAFALIADADDPVEDASKVLDPLKADVILY